MQSREIQEKKIKPCSKCGEGVVKRVTRRGNTFDATVYQDGHKLVILVKNGYEVEHRHI